MLRFPPVCDGFLRLFGSGASVQWIDEPRGVFLIRFGADPTSSPGPLPAPAHSPSPPQTVELRPRERKCRRPPRSAVPRPSVTWSYRPFRSNSGALLLRKAPPSHPDPAILHCATTVAPHGPSPASGTAAPIRGGSSTRAPGQAMVGAPSFVGRRTTACSRN